MNKFFINEFITLGLDSYFNKNDDNIFEKHIIECLFYIYGKDFIKLVYDKCCEETFICEIRKYDLPAFIYSNLLGDMLKYEEFKKSYESGKALKTDVVGKIESKIITMFKYKTMFVNTSLEEINKFETLLLKDFEIKILRYNFSLDPDETNKLWNKEKKNIINSVELKRVNVDFLDPYLYVKYGTTYENVSKMDYRMVQRLNEYIENSEAMNKESKIEKRKDLLHIPLTSGYKALDALIISSVIVTELSLGAIILFLNL